MPVTVEGRWQGWVQPFLTLAANRPHSFLIAQPQRVNRWVHFPSTASLHLQQGASSLVSYQFGFWINPYAQSSNTDAWSWLSPPAWAVAFPQTLLRKGIGWGEKETPTFGPVCTEVRMMSSLRLLHVQQRRDFSLQTQDYLHYWYITSGLIKRSLGETKPKVSSVVWSLANRIFHHLLRQTHVMTHIATQNMKITSSSTLQSIFQIVVHLWRNLLFLRRLLMYRTLNTSDVPDTATLAHELLFTFGMLQTSLLIQRKAMTLM